jgi:GGDEF domain-containing protein
MSRLLRPTGSGSGLPHEPDSDSPMSHLAGDTVLRAPVSLKREQTRLADVAARYGRGVFAVLLSETNGVQAVWLAARLPRATAALESSTPPWGMHCWSITDYRDALRLIPHRY